MLARNLVVAVAGQACEKTLARVGEAGKGVVRWTRQMEAGGRRRCAVRRLGLLRPDYSMESRCVALEVAGEGGEKFRHRGDTA